MRMLGLLDHDNTGHRKEIILHGARSKNDHNEPSTIAIEDMIVDSYAWPHLSPSLEREAKPKAKKFVLGEVSLDIL